mmetsp:Transcript_28166/g.51303  ORF Transcript_28166/g.51303 Transcript_28166/m.51303 type:complete len:88 (-) Transcript_28166:247-510(-)
MVLIMEHWNDFGLTVLVFPHKLPVLFQEVIIPLMIAAHFATITKRTGGHVRERESCHAMPCNKNCFTVSPCPKHTNKQYKPESNSRK